MRVVLDANVLISALLSRTGSPATLVRLWLDGEFELVVCPALLAETKRALGRPKLRVRVDAADATQFRALVGELAEVVDDPEAPPPVHSPDTGDDYLLALAARENVPLVSGDEDLLELRDRAPVFSPREFPDRFERE